MTASALSRIPSSQRSRVLVVDDEVNARSALAELLKDEGYQVETAADAFKALGKVRSFGPHILLTDLKMPGMDGIELMHKLRDEEGLDIPVIVMTAFGAVDTAVEAMRAGAVDYLTKPLNFDELAIVLERALANRRVRDEAAVLRGRLEARFDGGRMVGQSNEMQAIFEVIDQVAPARASVLITGDSGTGKELVAEAIHQRSPRKNGPFIKLHCAALAETLLESELFGHERGSFTGAIARKDGRLQAAHGGTLFLDEIGEISPAVQVKLLRFLQERELERVGGNETINVDVRIIAATNRDLEEEVREGRFREDLYYRLNVVCIRMPTLSERPVDVPLLADHFLRKYCQENAKNLQGFAPQALDAIRGYDWPGNVRELENAIERAVVMAPGARVEVGDLPPSVRERVAEPVNGAPRIPGSSLEDIERYAILQTLEATGGSTQKAARMLGISVRKIQYRLHEYKDAPKSGREAVKRSG